VLLPACVAWIVQVPAVTNVAVAPLTVHTLAVVEANETGKPDVAVALNVNGVPTVCVNGWVKVIVCAVGAAVIVTVTAPEPMAPL
jgi:hypothetical protein